MKSINLRQEELPLSWSLALLAVIPGLLATAGLTNTDFSTRILHGAVLLSAHLLFAYFWNGWRFPGWSLVAAGMLAYLGLTIALRVLQSWQPTRPSEKGKVQPTRTGD